MPLARPVRSAVPFLTGALLLTATGCGAGTAPPPTGPRAAVGKDNSGDGDGVRVRPLTMETVYGEIRDPARIFGVRERGEELVAELKGRVKKATSGGGFENATVLYRFANSEAPHTAGCCGAPGIVPRELGAKNVLDDTKEERPRINGETAADRDPDVLVIGDLTRRSQSAESAAKKIDFLESDPVTRSTTAVKNKRYVLPGGQVLNPTIRTAEAVEKAWWPAARRRRCSPRS